MQDPQSQIEFVFKDIVSVSATGEFAIVALVAILAVLVAIYIWRKNK